VVRAIKEHVTVQPGGVIQIRRPDLPSGTIAEVVVTVDDATIAPSSGESQGNNGDAWQALPGALHHIKQAIEDSRSLIQFSDDWDEAGSPAIDESTWRRAAEFLARHAQWVWESCGKVIESPHVTPGPDGSIDLHWDYPTYEMLINIPADARAMAGFYGDDRGNISIKGKFDASRANEGLLQWLVKSR